MSDEIRESLQRAASGEPSVGDAFARFEAARRRAGIARGVVIAVVALALAMSFAFVFPNPFTSGRPANFQEGGPFEPKDEVVNLYQDEVVRYEVRYATGWGVRGEPGAPAVFVEKPGDAFPVFVERDDATGLDAPVQSFIRVTPIDRECFPSRVCEHPAPGDFADAGADVEVLAGGEVAGRKVRAYLMEIPGSTDVASLSRGHVVPCVECALVSYWLNWNDRWIIRVDAIAVDEDTLGELIPDADRFMSSLTDYVDRPFG